MSVGAILAAAVPLLLLILFLQFRWNHRHILAGALKLPYPEALPILGNALLFIGGISSLRKLIIKLTTQIKEVFCIWIGPVPVFVVARPEDVQAIILSLMMNPMLFGVWLILRTNCEKQTPFTQILLNSSNALEKDDVYKFLKPFMGNGVFTGPVHLWRKYRRLISPMLHSASLENYLPVFNDVSRQLTDRFSSSDKIDPRFGIFKTTVDTAMNVSIFVISDGD